MVVSISHFPDDYSMREIVFEVDDRLAELLLDAKDLETANVIFSEIKDLIFPTFYSAEVGLVFLENVEALNQFPYLPKPKN